MTAVPGGLDIAPYAASDEDELFAAFAEVVEEGASYPHRPPADRETFRSAWLDGMTAVQVARVDGRLAGSYYVKPNYPGRAAHICNAGYLVASAMRGRGVGRALAEHSLEQARELGFDAMVFNLVFERNPARRLWESLGFVEVGRIPDAVDGQAALVYWRSLE